MKRLLLFLFLPLCLCAFSKRTFSFTMEPIDVVIPCAPKDLRCLEACIEGIRRYGADVRRVVVVSKERLTESAEWFSEEAFPFSKEEVALEIFRGDAQAARAFREAPNSRIGWLFQQLLKLYAPFVIPDLSSNVLILDADVIFLRSVAFRRADGSPYLTSSNEHHTPYFEHAARLLEGLRRVDPNRSGIAHHMLFQKEVLEDLFALVQEQHAIEPWRAICRAIDLNDVSFAAMSEYEIYFNFIQLRSGQCAVRDLRWTLIHSLRVAPGFKTAGYTFVCYPTWLAP